MSEILKATSQKDITQVRILEESPSSANSTEQQDSQSSSDTQES